MSESGVSSNLSIQDLRRVVVVGAGHGIGYALVEALLELPPHVKVVASYHRAERATPLTELAESTPAGRLTLVQTDPLDEASLGHLRDAVDGPLDLVVNATGFLHDDVMQPERSLATLTLVQMQHTFNVNTFVTPLLAKVLKSAMARDRRTAFVALSAKVGSIADNSLGGWHSYRASKTALNMFVKNIALEFGRTGLAGCSVLAIHPGTTATDLSEPFVRNVKHRVWTPAESARHVLDTIESASGEGTGLFKNWDGSDLPW